MGQLVYVIITINKYRLAKDVRRFRKSKFGKVLNIKSKTKTSNVRVTLSKILQKIKFQRNSHLKPSLMDEPKLAKLEATVDAGTVSDLWILLCAGGLPSKVADLCTEDRNNIGSSERITVCTGSTGGLFSGGGVTHVTGCSKAPKGSFSVTKVLGDTLKRKQNP